MTLVADDLAAVVEVPQPGLDGVVALASWKAASA